MEEIKIFQQKINSMGIVNLLIIFVIFIITAFILGAYSRSDSLSNSFFRSNDDFINPTVTSNLNKHFIVNFKPLKEKYINIQNSYKHKTYIYFLYLANSSWIGLGEKEMFYAASTIKVPLVMSIYEAIEQGVLNRDTEYSIQDFDIDQDFGELYKEGPDTVLTIDDLISLTLEKSDNTAAFALRSVTQGIGMTDPFFKVYQAMGWDIDISNHYIDYISINLKTLANMFLALYNSSYLNIEHSNTILSHLANSDFNDKIVAGVPESVAVSHKIGIIDSLKTYSDCGVVYAPNRHYLLCLASIGSDEVTASRFMRDISEATYGYVINN